MLWLTAASGLAADSRPPGDDPPAIGQLDKAPKLALVIGIDAYAKGWPKRRNAVSDAKLVGGEFLRHGYKVAILTNPDSRRLSRALKQFLLLDGDHAEARMFIWYSGHTHTIGGTSYLVPADAPLPRRESEFKDKAIPLDAYADLLRRAPAAQVYTVIDAPVAAIEFDARHGSEREGAPHLPVRQFLSSAAVGQAIVDDGSFRRLFLRALAGINRADSNLDKILTADEMGAYMTGRVAALTKNRQTPLYGRLPGREFAGGDYAFRVSSSHRLDFLAAGQGRDRRDEVAEIEKVLWSAIQDSEDPRKFESFLKVYPDGAFAEQAFARLNDTSRPNATAVAEAPAGALMARAETAPTVVAMSRGVREKKPALPPDPPAHPRSRVEMAEVPAANPFDAPLYPALPIISLEKAAPKPALPPAAEIVPASVVAPIPLEPGGEMAVPVMPSPPPRAAAPSRVVPPSPQPRVEPASLAMPPRALPGPSVGGREVQLGAFRAHVVAERALRVWREQVPDLFASAVRPVIHRADLGQRGTFYRVRVAGFGDSRKAAQFCAAFKGAGRDCYVVP